jgi:hypothetical protein
MIVASCPEEARLAGRIDHARPERRPDRDAAYRPCGDAAGIPRTGQCLAAC